MKLPETIIGRIYVSVPLADSRASALAGTSITKRKYPFSAGTRLAAKFLAGRWVYLVSYIGVDESGRHICPDLSTEVVLTTMFLVDIAAFIVTQVRGRTRRRRLKGGDLRRTRRTVRRAV
jgi:hypothetical protein